MKLNQYIDPLIARLTIGAALLTTLALMGWAVTN